MKMKMIIWPLIFFLFSFIFPQYFTHIFFWILMVIYVDMKVDDDMKGNNNG